MTNRVRIEPALAINTLEQAEAAMRRIGEIERDIELTELEANSEIDAIKKSAAAEVAKLKGPLDDLIAGLHSYALANKADLKKKRNWVTAFGKFGFQNSTRVSLVSGTEADAIEIAEANGWLHLVDIKKKLSKSELAKESDGRINSLGYARQPVESFGYTVDKARIAELPK